jgi:NAD(P)-dependent dehydrogenase (short-subunit alcohol dehydrogenase family)
MLGQDPALYENIMSMKESMTYSVIKGGITNSVRSMAAYYGKYKIRINAVCPGGVIDKQNKSFVERYKKKTPIQRMATPEDISNATIFLASKQSSYITGTNLIVDGGFSII